CMTRSSSNNLHIFDPEIDRTLYRLRKARSIDVGGSSSFISVPDSVNNICTTNHPDFSESNSFDSKPNIFDKFPMSRTQSYELKSKLIHLLPKFHGLAGEDLHKHLKEFHVEILEDYIKMKAFHFSLDGAVKD
ncbi:hypothetical protein CR513_15187, partial [Mucuna pruriens]